MMFRANNRYKLRKYKLFAIYIGVRSDEKKSNSQNSKLIINVEISLNLNLRHSR